MIVEKISITLKALQWVLQWTDFDLWAGLSSCQCPRWYGTSAAYRDI